MTFLLSYSRKLIHELDSNYRLKRFLDYFPILGLLFEYINLWEDLSLTLTIVQTLLLIIGEYKVVKENGVTENASSFFNLSDSEARDVFAKTGILQIIFASIIFMEFILRKCPTYYKIIDEKLVFIT